MRIGTFAFLITGWAGLVLAPSALYAAVIRSGAGDVTLEGSFEQGGIVRGIAPAGAKITFSDKTLPVLNDGRFVIGFDRDDDNEQTLEVTKLDGSKEQIPFTIAVREYDVQRIDNIPKGKVNVPENKKIQARINQQNAEIAGARKHFTQEHFFENQFVWPVEGKISGIYGSQRVLNGTPKRPHYGVDIAAPEGTVMVSPADGIIRLAQKDNYFSGNTVVIDHGYGLNSTYLHLSRMDVKPGQQVSKGQKIGEVGMTGRATGPHLCWRVHWFNTPLDPMLVVEQLPLGGEAKRN